MRDMTRASNTTHMSLNKKLALGGVALAILAIVSLGAYWYFTTYAYDGLSAITVDNETVYVYVADTEAKRELGLSGRKYLPADQGMLFIFPVEGKPSFWMKDMHFPIDILWLANDGSVIHIEENVSPNSYPQQFAPESGLARYVLELPAGYSEAHGLDIGSKVEI